MTVKIFYWNEEKEDFDRRRYNQVETAEYNAKWSKLWLTFLTKREPMCLHIDKMYGELLRESRFCIKV